MTITVIKTILMDIVTAVAGLLTMTALWVGIPMLIFGPFLCIIGMAESENPLLYRNLLIGWFFVVVFGGGFMYIKGLIYRLS